MYRSLTTLMALGLVLLTPLALALDEVWIEKGISEATPKLSLHVPAAGSAPASAPVTFECHLTSTAHFEGVLVRFIVLDADEQRIAETSQVLNLAQGPNRCAFHYEAGALAPGNYSVLIEAVYTSEGDAAYFQAPFKRVTSDYMHARLATATASLEELRTRGQLARDVRPTSMIGVRLNIADDFLKQAQGDATAEAWHRADRTLNWLENTLTELRAQMAFGGGRGDYQAIENEPLAEIDVYDGALRAGGRPVFLFGRSVDVNAEADIEMLARYGLNLAEVVLSPATTLQSAESTASFESDYAPAFNAAERTNVAVAVSLEPNTVGGWARDAWPSIDTDGHTDLVNPGVRKITERHIRAAAPFLAQQSMVAAVSLAEQPTFKIYSPEVHRGFIEYVKSLYPDRQDLNRLWRAHLASFEDITVWGHYLDGRPDPEIPDHSYQNRRAYQSDWQTYHRRLATQYFDWLRDSFSELAPSVPLTVTLTDSIFETGETRGGVDREAVAKMFDLTGCVATTNPADSLYALSYPRQAAYYTLMRSLQPEKPVFTMAMNIVLDEAMSPSERANYVESVLWEGVVSGMSAAALPADSGVFETPETVEAFARAAADINRLAPVIVAFQRAPADVGILFSSASKILDDGVPHLESAWDSYEGASFAGYNVRFITEEQTQAGALDDIHMLIIPETPAVSDATFERLVGFVDGGGSVARVGTPIPYNEHGLSRLEVLRNTGTTVFVRGLNLPTEYLHAMDAASEFQTLPYIPRPVNQYGFPLEGVKTRYVEVDGQHYLYAINLRKTPVECHLTGILKTGRDLIDGNEVVFPAMLQPLDPMLIQLDKTVHEVTLTADEVPES